MIFFFCSFHFFVLKFIFFPSNFQFIFITSKQFLEQTHEDSEKERKIAFYNVFVLYYEKNNEYKEKSVG